MDDVLLCTWYEIQKKYCMLLAVRTVDATGDVQKKVISSGLGDF